jgi:hypothetical protein
MPESFGGHRPWIDFFALDYVPFILQMANSTGWRWQVASLPRLELQLYHWSRVQAPLVLIGFFATIPRVLAGWLKMS